MGDYILSPAYDLMCTVLHTPLESDTALGLYKDSMDSPFYNIFGFYGQADFRTLADKKQKESTQMHKWMESYAYRAPLSWWIFGAACAGILLVTVLTVSYQSLRAARYPYFQ